MSSIRQPGAETNGLGCRVWGLGFRVWGFGGVRVETQDIPG